MSSRFLLIIDWIFIFTIMLVVSSCSSVNPASSVTSITDLPVKSPGVTSTSPPTRTSTLAPKPATITPTITPSQTPSVAPSYTLTIQVFTRTPIIPTWYLPIPTTDYLGFGDIWSTYFSKDEYRFSFEYPKLYNGTQYYDCRPSEKQDDNWLFYICFGYRSELAVTQNDLPTLDDYIDRWTSGDLIEYRDYQIINNIQAITIDYRFGGLNRFGTSTFIGQDELIYIFNFTAGGMCDLNEIDLDEFTIYKHAVETFRFTAPNP